jgi:hypothetical protein
MDEPRFTQTHRPFSMDCGVEITIRAMTARFSGLMLPLIKASVPDFGPVFEPYAKDLKQAAEGVTPRSP